MREVYKLDNLFLNIVHIWLKMYRHFSKYYDALLADADAYDLWLDFLMSIKRT